MQPKQYDLSQPAELTRLMQEIRGYIHTCRREHHGTDFKGRQFAIEALERICNGQVRISLSPQDRQLSSVNEFNPQREYPGSYSEKK